MSAVERRDAPLAMTNFAVEFDQALNYKDMDLAMPRSTPTMQRVRMATPSRSGCRSLPARSSIRPRSTDAGDRQALRETHSHQGFTREPGSFSSTR